MPLCPLCWRRRMLEHILGSCPKALPSAEGNSWNHLQHHWPSQAPLTTTAWYHMLRQNIVLASDTSVEGVLLELTLPQEECIEKASKKRSGKICKACGGVLQKRVVGSVFAYWSACLLFTSAGDHLCTEKKSHWPSFRGSWKSFNMAVDHEEKNHGLILLRHRPGFDHSQSGHLWENVCSWKTQNN